MKSYLVRLIVFACGFVLADGLVRATPIPDDCQTGGFALGCQAWTFNHFSVMEAIQKTAEAGGKVIEFYPGQKFSPDQPDAKFDHNATDEMIAAVKAQLEKYGIRAVNYGVVAIPKDEDGARKIFEFAKNFQLYGITTESVDSIDTIEKLVKEYDIRVGFHDHQRQPLDPFYKMWDPNYVLSVVKDRDPRIGSCADTGHWVQSGLKPVDCLKILKGRIMSSHLKDLNVPLPSGHDVPWGQGVSDVPGILNEYKEQGFVGPISVEYEYHQEDNLAEAKECIDYIRAYGEKK